MAAFLFIAVAVGCSSSRAMHGAPADNLRALPAEQEVRLLLVGGDHVDVDHVTVVGDSLHARLRDDHQVRRYGDRARSRQVTYALADLRAVESTWVDPLKTSLFIVVCAAVMAGLVAVGGLPVTGW